MRRLVTRANNYRIRQEKSSGTVLLVPYGPVEEEDLRFLMRALSQKGMKVSIASQREVPATAFNSVRRQYRGELFLESAHDEAFDRVLAVTNYDLYTNNLNFIFGLAEAREKCAVISLFRLRMGVDEERFHSRAVKEAVHELGHSWGLSHCPNPRCVMHFSNSLEDTDRKETEWCESCERKL
jgi:archaemetzincin